MAIAAAEELQKEGRSVRVVNARFIKPIDEKMLKEILNEGLPILTIEEAVLQGGFGSSILSLPMNISLIVRSLTEWGYLINLLNTEVSPELLEEIGMTKEDVIRRIRLLMPLKTHKGIGS